MTSPTSSNIYVFEPLVLCNKYGYLNRINEMLNDAGFFLEKKPSYSVKNVCMVFIIPRVYCVVYRIL